jgi:hypothetical protein
MEMWIHGDWLGMECASVSAGKQQTFSMFTGDSISGCAEKNAFILLLSLVLGDK